MKFPLFSSMTKSLALGSMMLLTLFILTVPDVNGQRRGSVTMGKDESIIMAVGHDIRGCHNGARNTPELACTGGAWANGNMNSGDSQWVEGEYVAIRDVITGLTGGSTGNTVTINYDTTKSGKHAFDYLGTYDASTGPPNGPGGNNPCSGVASCSSPTTFAIPNDPNIPLSITQPSGRNITIWNGTITAISTPSLAGSYASNSTTSITVTFSVNPGETTAVIAFGAHVGTRIDWGIGNTAVSIGGSPYHVDLNEGGGQVQMATSAAIYPAFVTIIKEVTTLGAPPGTTSTFSFGFNFTQNAVSTPFSLVDDVPGSGGGGPPLSPNATEVFQVLKFGAANTITVTENNYAPTWTLSGITCSEFSGGTGLPNVVNSTTSIPTRTATIIAEEGELIVCTFANTQFQPTAAPASISGRVTTAFGNGIGGARVTVMNAQTGEAYVALTNPFGYYTIDGPEVDNFYVMTVSSKRYTFADDTRTFTLHEDLVNMDFIANP